MPILKFFDKEIRFDGTPTLKEVLVDFLPCAKTDVCSGCTLKACQMILTEDTVIDSDIVIETKSGATSICDGVAIDIGTTTVVCEYIKNGKSYIAAAINPQSKIAPDVIGRIDYSINSGKDVLQSLIADCLKSLCKNAPENIVITGNTAMLYLLTGKDTNELAHAPFEAKSLFGEYIDGVYFPRCISAFVGADTTCAILASDMCDKNETSLLLDIGTNGEIALWHNGKLYTTSCAAGPVFEGAGIECGMMASHGAIDKVYSAGGRIFASTIGGENARGICGSGVIDAVATLIELDELYNKKTIIDGNIYITQNDIQKLMFAKAAIRAGIEVLCENAGVAVKDIVTLYVAGGFGSHINLVSAAKIGLIPSCLVKCAVTLGNAALSGAKLMFDKNNIKKSEEIANSAVCINLGGNKRFNERFIDNLKF